MEPAPVSYKGQNLGILLAVIYGIMLRVIVEANAALSGALSMSFVIAAPLVIGAISVYYSGTGEILSLKRRIFYPWISVIAILFTSFVTLLEGSICIILLLPAYLVIASLGGLIGGALYHASLNRSNKALMSFAVLPLLLTVGEGHIDTPTVIGTVSHSINIEAPAATVWSHIKDIADITPEEFSASFIYAIGVPYPRIGRLDEQTNIRLSRWDKGIAFSEYVVEHIDNRYIRWTYDFKPGDIPAQALDEHVEIGGRYFDVIDTSYTATPSGDGSTELSLTISYRLSTNINWYARLWTDFLIADFERQILRVYKNRAEAKSS